LVAYADCKGQSRRAINDQVASVPTLPGCSWWSPDMARSVGVAHGVGDCDITRIAASPHQNAAHARHIITRVKQVPAATDPCFEPCREITRG
jgi:hypothetical protein